MTKTDRPHMSVITENEDVGLKHMPSTLGGDMPPLLGIVELREQLKDLLSVLEDPDVELLDPSMNATAIETLIYCLRETPRDALMVLYYDENNDLCTRSSKMNRADAVFMLETAKMHALTKNTE